MSADIASAIAPDGSVLDSAAPGLGLLRRQIRDAYADVDTAMERVIGTSAPQGALQDRVVSVRSERLVLQVKAEMRHRVPGIVHDASNTGATVYVEPFATVDLCNRWRELALEERREVERVLYRLSSEGRPPRRRYFSGHRSHRTPGVHIRESEVRSGDARYRPPRQNQCHRGGSGGSP